MPHTLERKYLKLLPLIAQHINEMRSGFYQLSITLIFCTSHQQVQQFDLRLGSACLTLAVGSIFTKSLQKYINLWMKNLNTIWQDVRNLSSKFALIPWTVPAGL